MVAPAYTGEHGGFLFALYPRRGGRPPNLDDPKALEWIGRFIGRIHAVGAIRKFQHREALTPKSFGHDARAFLLGSNFIPPDLLDAWKAVTAMVEMKIEKFMPNVPIRNSMRRIALRSGRAQT